MTPQEFAAIEIESVEPDPNWREVRRCPQALLLAATLTAVIVALFVLCQWTGVPLRVSPRTAGDIASGTWIMAIIVYFDPLRVASTWKWRK